MIRSVSRVLKHGFIAGCAAVLLMSAAATADAAPAYSAEQQIPAQQIADFKTNPAQLLNANPNGGAGLIARARDLLASDPTTLNAIMALLPTATADQKAALGTALAQAARLYTRADQAVATAIQQAVVASGDDVVQRAYLAAAGDTQIAAGGGAGGGGVGGGTSGSSNNGGSNSGAPQQIGGNNNNGPAGVGFLVGVSNSASGASGSSVSPF